MSIDRERRVEDALRETLARYDAVIVLDPAKGYHYGSGPSVEFIAKGVAARLGDSLDDAFAAISAALPSRGWWVVAIEHNSDDEPPSWRAVEQSGRPHVYGDWSDTAAAALQALTAKLATLGTPGAPES